MQYEGLSQDIRIKCISKNLSNFIYNKTYDAHASFIKMKKYYTGYKVYDEDGDSYTLQRVDIGNIFEII